MDDILLSSQDCEEELSRIYVSAVAAISGYCISCRKFDRDGVDIQINAGGAMRPALDLQLKATVNLGDSVNGHYSYALKRRNYDLLRVETQTPRLLIVLKLPKENFNWVTIDAEKLIIRKCAFWVNLKGLPETNNSANVTVKIDQSNIFDVDALRLMMQKARSGELL